MIGQHFLVNSSSDSCPCSDIVRPMSRSAFFLGGAGDPSEEIIRYASVVGSDLAVLVGYGLTSARHHAIFQSVVGTVKGPVLILRSS